MKINDPTAVTMLSFDPAELPFTRPAPQVKAVNLPEVPQSIIDGMKKYEDAARVFTTDGFEVDYTDAGGQQVLGGIIVQHRPADARVAQLYRISRDPQSHELERLSYFDLGGGNRIQRIAPIAGDDWRGVWRPGGWLLAMDINGNENFQLWRYWEDKGMKEPLPAIEGELENKPGPGRFERLTHDDYRYQYFQVSRSGRLLAFTSNKENGSDTLAYITSLKDSNTGPQANSDAFHLPARLITPPRTEQKEAARMVPEDFSLDETRLLLMDLIGASCTKLYIADLTADPARSPERVIVPQFVESADESIIYSSRFSTDPDTPNLIYINTDGFGDFRGVVAFDLESKTVVQHITTAEPSFKAMRPIGWDTVMLAASPHALYFVANADGWQVPHVIPLTGTHKYQVIEIRLKNWVGGGVGIECNDVNGKPFELVLKLTSYRAKASLAHLDLAPVLENVQTDAEGGKYVDVEYALFHQAQAARPGFPTPAPKLLRFPSFDGLEVPVLCYRPEDKEGPLPLLIQIHGGPASQVTPYGSIPIHGYVLNELGCAMMYPNVRGSVGYGKRYKAADDVEKREDSVKDIEALLDYIKTSMKDEIDSSRIAVIGGSYGGYMVLACLASFSSKLTCGVVNYGIAHWPSFLQKTAAHRRDNRRREYGDERDPKILEFLERISPRNNAGNITVPLQIAHGETDSRVPVYEAYLMYDILTKNGAPCELMVLEKEGHGYKQKSVIEFTNAAKLHFIQRHLLGYA